MAIETYLHEHQVFTSEEFNNEFPSSRTDRNLLQRAVSRGKVSRPHRGLYVSRTGRFEGTDANPFDVVAALDPQAVFVYASALQLLGGEHNVLRRVQFAGSRRWSTFSHAGVMFECYPMRPDNTLTRRRSSDTGRTLTFTTREQTLIDCLENIDRAAGPENLLRSISSWRRLDVHAATELALSASRSTSARFGWLLTARASQWHPGAEDLHALHTHAGAGPYYFQPSDRSTSHWDKDWSLYLPRQKEELSAWMAA